IAVISFVMLAMARRAFASCCATTAPSPPTTYQAAAATVGAGGMLTAERDPQAGPAKATRRTTAASGAQRIRRRESVVGYQPDAAHTWVASRSASDPAAVRQSSSVLRKA